MFLFGNKTTIYNILKVKYKPKIILSLFKYNKGLYVLHMCIYNMFIYNLQ